MAEEELSSDNHVEVCARRKAKRQRYTLVACDKCKKRKIKCSGETPCRQCTKQGAATDCVYDRLLPGNGTLVADSPQQPAVLEGSSAVAKVVRQHVLWPLTRLKAIELLDSFQEDVETLYPFIDLQEMKSLVYVLFDCTGVPHKSERIIQTSTWDDNIDFRNVDFLKLLLACAMAPKGNIEEDLSSSFILSVEENTFKRVRCLNADLKDLAIATLLSVYHYQRNSVKLAWRQIGVAARLALELGLHRLSDPALDKSGMRNMQWANRFFWCIYVLDRRYSFMNNLPFTIQDRDIDFKLLQPDKSAPYLLPMVVYGRLGGKIMPAVPKFGHRSEDLDNNTKANLGNEIDRWVEATSIEASSMQLFDSIVPNLNLNLKSIYHFKVFIQIRANQMRLSLYKHSLYTPLNISNSRNFARIAVQVATENIRVLNQLKDESDDFYKSHALHYRHFLIPSLFSLYLAIRNAPLQFGTSSFEFFAGLNLLKSSITSSIASEHLKTTVQTLEKAIHSLRLGTTKFWGSSITPPLSFIALPGTKTRNSSGKSVQPAETTDFDWRVQDSLCCGPPQLLSSPAITTPDSHFNFEIQDRADSFMNEMLQEQNLFQDLAMNDVSLSDFWNSSPDFSWDNPVAASGEFYLMPENA